MGDILLAPENYCLGVVGHLIICSAWTISLHCSVSSHGAKQIAILDVSVSLIFTRIAECGWSDNITSSIYHISKQSCKIIFMLLLLTFNWNQSMMVFGLRVDLKSK